MNARLREWADLHGEDGDDRPCNYWIKGYPSTHYEPGEPSHCGNPEHCPVHWQDVVHTNKKNLPKVDCPVCHKPKVVNDYQFDEQKGGIIAAVGAMCEDCEMECAE